MRPATATAPEPTRIQSPTFSRVLLPGVTLRTTLPFVPSIMNVFDSFRLVPTTRYSAVVLVLTSHGEVQTFSQFVVPGARRSRLTGAGDSRWTSAIASSPSVGAGVVAGGGAS